MKEVQDLVKDLLASLTEATDLIDDSDSFDGRQDLLVAVDSAYNEISYALSQLG